MLTENDMSGLLSAEHISVGNHRLIDILIANRGHTYLDALALHRFEQSHVGHDRGNHRIILQTATFLQILPTDIQDIIPVYFHAVLIHGNTPVSISVKRKSAIQILLPDKSLQILDMCRSTSHIDVGTVRLIANHICFGTKRIKHTLCNIKRTSVGTIQPHASSCSDYLDKEYDASLSEKKVFNNQNLTREFLANIYTNLPDGLAPLSDDQFTGASRDCMTDNAVTCWGLHYYTKIGSDGYTAGDHPLLGFWNTDLYGIRKCNMFLKNAKASVVGNTEKDGDDNRLYDRYCAEARLLRAIFHFDLICWFGAAPVIAEDESGEPIIFDLSDPSAMNMFRTPAAEALEWVADQCDQIKNQLPFRYSDEASNWGRVNGAAAYALKARALLYRASKLNNPDGNTAYWANAAQAAADFITQNNKQSYPYRLYNTGNPENDYYECFTTNPVYNNEIILARSVWNTNQVEKVFLPVGFTGSFSGNGRTNPTQNLVDAYEMSNGKRIDENGSTYDAANPYKDRDPRLAQTIFYQGMMWGRADKEERRAIDVRYNSDADKGVDYTSAMGGTYTGYYLKKFVNNISCKEPATYPHAWMIFRYGEILLNAAEAYNEAEGPAKAYSYINEVRARAGMPAYADMSQSELRERIRNERRIELAFEDHRFFDVRRWKLYDNVTSTGETGKPRYNQLLNLYGVKVTGNADTPSYTFGLAETVNSRTFVNPKIYYFFFFKQKTAYELGQ